MLYSDKLTSWLKEKKIYLKYSTYTNYCNVILLQGEEDNYILTNRDKPIEPNKYRLYYNRVLKELELPHRKFHALRHTFATRCIECGCDYKSLSELLGHSNVSITMNIYVHPQMELKRKCEHQLSQ